VKKVLLMIAVGALSLSAATFTGVVTDSMCANNHKMMGISPDDKCVLECIKHDKSVKLVLFAGKNVYKLSDQETPRRFAARKVRVTGELFPKTGVIRVDKIEPAN
jgi:hypothetical protein